DHPSIRGQKDEAYGGDTEPERLDADRAEVEVRDDVERGCDDEEDDDAGADRPVDPLDRAKLDVPPPAPPRGAGGRRTRVGGPHRRAHAGLPNRPCRRRARTKTSSAKVSRME